MGFDNYYQMIGPAIFERSWIPKSMHNIIPMMEPVRLKKERDSWERRVRNKS